MKKKHYLIASLLLLFYAFTAKSQISGRVFRDFNANGTKDNTATFNETFLAGVTVTAYNSAGVVVGTTTTSLTGPQNYLLSGVTTFPVRLEFTNLQSGDFTGPAGTGSATSVQFISATTTTANFGVNYPGHYTSGTNPDYVISQFAANRPPASEPLATALLKTNYGARGQTWSTNTTSISHNTNIGGTWGLAFDKQRSLIYAAAFVKRYSAMKDNDANGKEDIGAIYSVTTGGTSNLWLDVTNLGVDVGLSLMPTIAARALPTTLVAPTHDPLMYPLVGKIGIGDIEISDDNKFLYFVNLFDKKVYTVDIASKTLVGVGIAVPNPCNGSSGNVRPFGLKYHRGKIYVGAICDALTSQNVADLTASVFRLDGATFTSILNFPLNYVKGYAFKNLDAGGAEYGKAWKAWLDVQPAVAFHTSAAINSEVLVYPQPMLVNMEFDVDEALVLTFNDRLGHQAGEVNYGTNTGNTTDLYTAIIGGDVLRASLVGGVYTIESNGISGGVTSLGTGNTQGPGGGEFYVGDRSNLEGANRYHNEDVIGGSTFFAGRGEVAVVVTDPIDYFAGGVYFFDNTTGDVDPTNDRYQLYPFTSDVSKFGKANGLGDIELITSSAPIEIGNRVWNDANGNGIQDAGEVGIGGVALQIFLDANNDGVPDGAAIGSTTTASSGDIGSWYFNNSNITGDADPNTAGTQPTLTPGVNYIIRPAAAAWASGVGVGVLANLQLTITDKLSTGQLDFSDNDAVLFGTTPIPQISYKPNEIGENNHTLDIGFKPLASIGDRVWLDNGAGANAGNGIQDAGEPGVAGITVTLYQNGPDGNPGTSDDIIIGTTVTDAYGNYLFDNLTPSTSGTSSTMYNVGFTLPTNYQFTTQTNTQALPANNTNVTNTTTTSGGSTALNGSDANVTTGRTGSFFLAPGEAERGVDAGIIITPPATPSSIGDRVWFDTNSDGIQTAGEPGVAGVTVTLYKETTPGSGVYVPYATTITDVNGNYLFNNLPNNTNFKVGITPPAGTLLTTSIGGTTPLNTSTNSDIDPTTRLSAVVNIPPAGAQITGIDAGLVPQSTAKACLGDRVWHDINRDGVQDPGEPGIAGVQVELLDASGNSIDPDGAGPLTQTLTTTDAFGNYIFTNLDPGGYYVQFGAVAGMQRTSQNSTSGTIPDATDSDAQPTTGRTTGYVLVAGEKNMSVDAGYYSTQPQANVGALGDKVWNDLNGDGIQDANEPGVAGITVTLYNSAGTAIATTTTDINGNYLFAGLTPGNYSVGFSNLPAGFSFTGQDKGGNDAVDSDANPATGRTAQVAVTGGNTTTTLDAGIRQGIPSGLGSIGNKVWWDIVNANNIQDPGEAGVAGVTVTLLDYGPDGVLGGGDDGATRTTTTNALGEYMFTGLPASNYVVQFSNLPVGSSTVTQNSGTDATIDSDGSAVTNATALSISTSGLISLAAGEDNLTIDLGIRNTAKGAFGNRVWYDNGAGGGTANNGIQDGGEIGVAGVMVTLVNAAGQPVDRTGAVTTNPITTTTDANGYYSFADLTAGAVFAAKFSNLPAGFDFTSKVGVGAGDDSRSDADIVSGLTPSVTIVANTYNPSLDAGLISTRAALGNRVWNDLDNDGVQDETSPGSGIYTEPGVAGVTVTLFRPGFGLDGIAGNADDALPVASMITDANGAYFFGNLIPGDYQVEFTTIPTGMIFTQQNTPGDNQNNTNSDAVPANGNGRTGTITLSAGEVDLTIDAGLTVARPATIGNKVWADLNTDGVQDAGEPGIAGVIVTLYNSSNQPIGSAITDGNGNWQITNVPTGTGYYVIFTPNLPSFNTTASPGTNPAWTIQNVGANGTAALDSGTESDTDSDVTATGANAGRTGTFSIVPGNNFPNIDAGIINWPLGNILPIQLVSFVANPKGNSVELTWVVATETNVANYEVEYSATGANFVSIGAKTATGSRTYNLVHTSPKQGLNYYRLKIIDKDGKVSYSEVRKVNFGAAVSTVQVYPIPAVSNINITVTGSMINQPATITILSIDGRLMYQQQSAALSQTETINVNKLASGKYIVRIVTANDVINKQIEIIK